MTFSLMTLGITTLCHYGEWLCAECRILFIVMLNVVLLIVAMQSVIMLSVIMLSVVMQSVVAPFLGRGALRNLAFFT